MQVERQNNSFPPEDHTNSKAQLTAIICSRSLEYETPNLPSQSHPIKAVINWAVKHFDVPTVSQVHAGQLVRVPFVRRLYTSDLMLDVTASSKG